MLENGENREIILIFPFKNVKTEDKNDAQIRRQLWTEMAGYKTNQKAGKATYSHVTVWEGNTEHTPVHISKKVRKLSAFPLPLTVPYNIVDVSERLFS